MVLVFGVRLGYKVHEIRSMIIFIQQSVENQSPRTGGVENSNSLGVEKRF